MVTNEQYQTFDSLFDYYNRELFGGELPDCMIVTVRYKNHTGFFKPGKWKNKLTEVEPFIHEINLNPAYFDMEDVKCHAVLVHEMVHLWQYDHGKPTRRNYHNREWSQRAEKAGLMPSSTGRPGGKKTGELMSQYVISDGLFIDAFNRLIDRQYKYMPSTFPGRDKAAKTGSRIKYTCPCKSNVWGKSGLSITCNVCNQCFKQAV